MPYILVPYKRGWRVKSETSGRYFSKKPMTKAKAIKQQRLLYAIEADGAFKEGKGYCEICAPDYKHKCDDTPDELDGGGLFNNIVASAKQFFSRAAKTVFTKAAEATARAVRMDYPPKVRQYLAQNGTGMIQNITIQRTPINSMIDKALNFLTAGKFEEAKRKYAYDNLFHLSMVCVYSIAGRIERVFIEKNQVINMTESYNIQKDTEIMPVPYEPGTLTLATMMSTAASKAGPAFFQYDAFTNNCQMFINTILDANRLNTPAVRAFVNQDAQALLQELPEFISPLARTLTNVAAAADRVIEGQGKRVGDTVVMKKSDFLKEHKRLLGLLKKHSDELVAEFKDQREELMKEMKKPGDIVTLPFADFIKEHKKLLALLSRYKDLQPEFLRQKKEMASYTGGGESDDEADDEADDEPEEIEVRPMNTRERQIDAGINAIVNALLNNQISLRQAIDMLGVRGFKPNDGPAFDEEEREYMSEEVPRRYWSAVSAWQAAMNAEPGAMFAQVSRPQFIMEEGPIEEEAPDDDDTSTDEEGAGKATHREAVLARYGLPDKSHSIAALAKVSGVPKAILQEVYNRGVGAYKTQPKSVRLKGSFVKNVDAPMSKKLSKEQWGYARVYSFLNGNPKHDNDLRANKGGAKQSIETQLRALGITPAEYLASVRASAKAYGIDPAAIELADDDSKITVTGPDGKHHEAGKTGYGDFHIYKLLEKKGAAPPGTAEQHRKAYLARATKIKGDWKKDKYSPNSLAVYVLWH